MGPPCQGGSQKQQRWKVPESFLDEVLLEARKAYPEEERSKKKYVIDLCAGCGSLRPVALEHGYIYVCSS